ncbi:hypothetical protein HC022_06120 [Salipiger sp. HF18]|uniref:hypothetical protein n=1 Tax=Salipiger sp. HF18 TaxID=2721557 RepID=UPI00142D7846|nr:hypothetical protein [Salipiger sp. HF18]NIY95840.1 hypothetical protein [Salipiger sp. HF18]
MPEVASAPKQSPACSGEKPWAPLQELPGEEEDPHHHREEEKARSRPPCPATIRCDHGPCRLCPIPRLGLFQAQQTRNAWHFFNKSVTYPQPVIQSLKLRMGFARLMREKTVVWR